MAIFQNGGSSQLMDWCYSSPCRPSLLNGHCGCPQALAAAPRPHRRPLHRHRRAWDEDPASRSRRQHASKAVLRQRCGGVQGLFHIPTPPAILTRSHSPLLLLESSTTSRYLLRPLHPHDRPEALRCSPAYMAPSRRPRPHLHGKARWLVLCLG